MRIVSLFVLVLSGLALVGCGNMQQQQKKEQKCKDCEKPCESKLGE